MTAQLRKILMGVAVLAALALGAGAIAQAGSSTPEPAAVVQPADEGDSSDVGDSGAVHGAGADQATEAALAITGGKANSVERDGENGATCEVEVTEPSGDTVDVRLDENYKLVVIEGDEGK